MSTRMVVATVRRQGWRAGLLALAIILMVVMTSQPKAASSVRVVAVPWQGVEAKSHPVTQNGSLVLQAAASNGDGSPVSLVSGSWDPGDGSGPQAINVSNPRVLELTWTYTGAVGTPYTATIQVTDSDNDVHTDTFKVQVQPNTLDTQANMAIDRALWYNHKVINIQTTIPLVQAGVANFSHPQLTGSTVVDQVSPEFKIWRDQGTGSGQGQSGLLSSDDTLGPFVPGAGPSVSFSSYYYSNVYDQVSPNLSIARFGPLYNYGSDQVKWALGTCAAPEGGWRSSFSDVISNVLRPNNGYNQTYNLLPGRTLCLADVTTNTAYELAFSDWQASSTYAYTRTEVGTFGTADQIQWAAGVCAAPNTPFYNTHWELLRNWFRYNGNTGSKPVYQSQIAYPQCARDVTTGQDYNFMILSWGNNNGEFSYYREGLAGGSAPVFGPATQIGFWNDSQANASTSAAVQAFEVNGHRQSGNAASDPYVTDTTMGLLYLQQHIRRVNIDSQGHAGTPADPSPDTNGNGYGLEEDAGNVVYVTGQVIDAFVASATPNALATVGSEAGRKYSDIAQDLLDAYAWGQNDFNQGGWVYNWNSQDGIDSSSSGWWGVGTAAGNVWHLDMPQWVKDNNKTFGIPTLQGGDGSCGYRSTSPVWSQYTDTTACMIMLSADDEPRSSARFTNAENYAAANFNSYEPLHTIYGMYNLTKAMRLAKDDLGNPAPISLLGGTVDWYAGLANNLVSNQRGDGKLAPQNADGVGDGLANSWGILILSPALFEQGPTAVCSVDATTVCVAGDPDAACNQGNADLYSTVNFDGSQSIAGDNAITSYSWNFDDGVPTTDSTSVTASTQYSSVGTYNVQLTVTDAHNNTSSVTCPVAVTASALPPIADAGGPYTMCIGSNSFVLDGSGSTGRGSTIVSYEWDFQGAINFAQIDATGATTEQSAYFNSLGLGTHDVGLQVKDDVTPHANTVNSFTTVTVVDCAPPVITVPANISVLTPNPSAPVSYSVSATDNVDASVSVVCTSAPTAGLSSGSDFPVGTTTITCDATDNAGNAALTKSFTVTVSNNQPPVALDDSAPTFSGTPVTVSVLGNDSDPDSDVLTVESTTQGSNGGVTTDGTTVTYTPNLGFAGSDTFAYTINDAHAHTATANVTVTVTKREATVTAGGGTKVYGNPDPALSATTQTGFLPADVAGIALASTRAPGSDVGDYATTATATGGNVANYNVTLGAGNFSITTRAVTVTADAKSKHVGTGDPALTYQVTSGSLAPGDSVAGALTRVAGETVNTYPILQGSLSLNANYALTYVGANLAITNVAPVAVGGTLTTNEDTAASSSVSATDADGDSVTFTVLTLPLHGGLTFNTATGAYTYTPAANYNGPDSFSFSASDGLLSSSATVAITVIPVNDPPVAVNDSYSGQWNTALTVAPGSLFLNDSDIDNDPLTSVIVTNANPSQGAVTLNANGGFSFMPAANFSGLASFTYMANDGLLNSNVATVSLRILSPCQRDDDRDNDDRDGGRGDRDDRGRGNNDHDRGLKGHHDGDGCERDRENHKRDHKGRDDADWDDCRRGTPEAHADKYSTHKNSPLSVNAANGVLDNDGSYAKVAQLFSNPAHGTVTLAANGSFLYTPALNFVGTDTFSYVPRSATNVAGAVTTVTITVQGHWKGDGDDHDKGKKGHRDGDGDEHDREMRNNARDDRD